LLGKTEDITVKMGWRGGEVRDKSGESSESSESSEREEKIVSQLHDHDTQ